MWPLEFQSGPVLFKRGMRDHFAVHESLRQESTIFDPFDDFDMLHPVEFYQQRWFSSTYSRHSFGTARAFQRVAMLQVSTNRIVEEVVMTYQQAQQRAQLAANQTGMDCVVIQFSWDWLNYNVAYLDALPEDAQRVGPVVQPLMN